MNVSFRFTSLFDCIKCMCVISNKTNHAKPCLANEKTMNTGAKNEVNSFKQKSNYVYVCMGKCCVQATAHIYVIGMMFRLEKCKFLLSHVAGQTCLLHDVNVAGCCCLRLFFFTLNLIRTHKSSSDVCLRTELQGVCLFINSIFNIISVALCHMTWAIAWPTFLHFCHFISCNGICL